ncbi:MAG TPA: hypothetical protein VGN86_17750 [Pyrinomonadaceae bacterium]|jgi:hypothetical protein|nr:hypothetical protein [Pyrinomonadaceae bacterium]
MLKKLILTTLILSIVVFILPVAQAQSGTDDRFSQMTDVELSQYLTDEWSWAEKSFRPLRQHFSRILGTEIEPNARGYIILKQALPRFVDRVEERAVRANGNRLRNAALPASTSCKLCETIRDAAIFAWKTASFFDDVLESDLRLDLAQEHSGDPNYSDMQLEADILSTKDMLYDGLDTDYSAGASAIRLFSYINAHVESEERARLRNFMWGPGWNNSRHPQHQHVPPGEDGSGGAGAHLDNPNGGSNNHFRPGQYTCVPVDVLIDPLTGKPITSCNP